MPRVVEINPLNVSDVVLAAKYLASNHILFGESIEHVAGSTLKISQSGELCALALVSEDSYGKVSFYCDDSSRVVFSEQQVKWVALFDHVRSDVSMVLMEHVEACLAAPQSYGQVLNMERVQGWRNISISSAWMKNSLAKRTVKIEGKKSFKDFRKAKGASKEQFCHLHVHSMYSFLDGVSTPEGIVKTAVENGQPGIAITDHGGMFGVLEFYQAARDAGIKPIIGVEFYIVDDLSKQYTDEAGRARRFEHHLTVLAMNNEGLVNLNTLCSLAYRDHLYYVPRIDTELLFKYSDGLIVLSGCFKGQVAWYLQNHLSDTVSGAMYQGKPIRRRDPDISMATMRKYKERLGDRYFVEAHYNTYNLYMAAVPEILSMANHVGVPVVVAADAHYEVEQDVEIQEHLLKIGTGKDENVRREGYYIRTMDEMMCPLFTTDMLTRTCEIMDRCSKMHIPIPGDADFKFLFPDYNVEADEDWGVYVATLAPAQAPAPVQTQAPHSTHPNSVASFRNMDKVIADRHGEVIEALKVLGQASDRQIMAHLGFNDPNAVRPRITELVALRVVDEVGSMVDPETNRTVRVVALGRSQ